MSGSLRLPVMITDDDLPLQSLVGPFFFDMAYFGSTLVRGSCKMGVFNDFQASPEERRTSLNYKKLLDVMIYLFTGLREPRAENDRLNLYARGFYGFLVPEPGVDVHELRDTVDISELYAGAKGLAFFILVDATESDDSSPFSALDFLLKRLMEENNEREKKSRAGRPGNEFGSQAKKRRLELMAQAMRNNASEEYGFTETSCDYSECFVCPQDFKRMLAALPCFGQGYYDMNNESLESSRASFSRNFNVARRAMENQLQPSYLQTLVRWNLDGEASLSARDGLCFRVDAADVNRYTFPLFQFPDLRRSAPVDQILPDLDTLEAVRKWDFDPHVMARKMPVFAVLREQMFTSIASMEARVARTSTEAEKRLVRETWRKRVVPVFKSKFSRTGRLAGSLKAIVEAWENNMATCRGIPVHVLPSLKYGELNAQQTMMAFLYDIAEDLGIYCQHTTLVHALLNARWACRKGMGRGPHMILYGPPGCGKSHVMETVKQLFDKGTVTSMSYFSEKAIFASKTENGEDNPDENFAQQILVIDEMRASDIGYSDSKEITKGERSQGEASDRVAVFKEMTSHSEVSYARNVEHKNQDGVSIRVTEKGTVTTEMVVLGGQNRPSGGMNSGFLRRFELRPCCIIRRHDGVTMEQCKKEEKLASISPLVQNLIKALQDNSRIHAVLGLLRYCGLVAEVPLDTWYKMVARFERALESITSVPNLDDRLDDARHRLELFTDMCAVALAFQSGNCPAAHEAISRGEARHLVSFDNLVNIIMKDVEAYAVPSEQACLCILGSLEEVCFPMFHRLVLCATAELSTEDHDESYFLLSGLKDSPRPREDAKGCAARLLFDALIDRFKRELFGLKMNEPELLMRGAIEELMNRTTGERHGRHAVINFHQDATGVQVIVSRHRLEKRDVGMADVLRQCLHDASPVGRQLLLAPYREGERYAPQYPMFFDVTLEDVQTRLNLNGDEFARRPSRTAPQRAREMSSQTGRHANLDDACFERYRKKHLHLSSEEAFRFHPRQATFFCEGAPSVTLPEYPEYERLFS